LGFLNPSELIKEYQQADLVITNGGQTLNEVILLGIPAIGIVVADNQKRNVQAWNKLGVIKKIFMRIPLIFSITWKKHLKR
jgi:UDP-2,4-diacetamido-2,4,6-trideoxy-beta-L-altropyranose hydrolase